MKIFVASDNGQGDRKSDYYWLINGEPVMLGFDCDRDRDDIDGGCGCRRGVVGMDSAKAGTTFTVEDRNVTVNQYRRMHLEAYIRQGWLKEGDSLPSDLRAACDEWADSARNYYVGDVIERRGDTIQRRSA